MLGDTAVCVNPEDERYLDLHGKWVELPLTGREIPVICDPLADPAFGTGVVKVTPAHDPNDFEAGKRHNLPHVKVIDQNAQMTAEAGKYAGLDRYEARKQVLADLEEQGLLEKTEPYPLSAGKCQRCKTVVEPLVSKQWFCRMKPLAEPAIRAVEEGRIRIIPDNHAKTYYEWMYNIRDWCVSRQLWWGHRIPAWHCADCGEVTVSREDAVQCARCGSKNIAQDPDVLDTWFSSGLWPFSTLGWPEETEDLKTYYPTTLLITGFDILFFWVARMIMLGLECMGDVPFRTVYIHGLVRDAQRQKMSKTKGNTIDPLAVTEQYGTDAVRFALLRGAAPGTDIALSEERMASSRAFANKIWNAARFIFLQMEKVGLEQLEMDRAPATVEAPAAIGGAAPLEDRWIYARLTELAAKMELAQQAYRYHEAADLVWTFLWDEFCDWYVEVKKLRVQQGAQAKEHVVAMLRVFEYALRLLHPAMPFITEELWQRLVKKGAEAPESITLAAYPQAGAAADEEGVKTFELLKEMVTAARALRADQKIDPGVKVEGWIETWTERAAAAAAEVDVVNALAHGTFAVNPAEQGAGARRASVEFAVGLKLSATQAEAMRQRVAKRIAELEKVIGGSRRQLSSEAFVAKAPAHVIEGIREKLAQYEAELKEQKAALEEMG
jgi:valyl-tRNA synthetase